MSGCKFFTPAAAEASFGLDMIKFDDCARWIIARLHPQGPKCPACAAPLVKEKQREHFFAFEQTRCIACGKKFTAATGTMLDNSKLEVREVYLIAVLTSLDVPAVQIAIVLHVHADTVRNWQGKFRAFQELAGA